MAPGAGAYRSPLASGFFGPLDRPIFGQLHPAATSLNRNHGLGMVICNPFGYEAICAHRSLRRFAEDAAALGIPTLRFDYDGTGDTFGDELDAGRKGDDDGDGNAVQAWVASIHHAVDHLARTCGTTRVVLFGVRLGATLASLAAAGRADVAGLVAVAPIVSGRAYVRELRALQMALGLGPAPSAAPSASPGPPPTTPAPASGRPEEGQEAVGFALSSATKRALVAIDLTKVDRPPAPEVLLLDRDDLPPSVSWVDRLRAGGATVEHQPLPGYSEMVLDPHKARVPEAMRAATGAWLLRRRDQAAAAAPAPPPVSTGPGPGTGTWAGGQRQAIVARGSDGAPVAVEDAGFIDAASILFGVTTRPAPQALVAASPEASTEPTARLGILLLNAGAIHHVGPNRLYVTLARPWAATGHTVLRLDLSGLGDSGTRRGQADNVVYGPHAGADVATAVRYLRAQPGVSRVVIVGLCSGAYHGFKAAVAGEPVSAIVPINPLTFFWKAGMSLDFPAHKVAQESDRYARSAWRLESWKKLARGEVHLRVLAEVLARRALSLVERRGRDVARRLGVPLPDDLGRELESLAARGVAMDFVFADGDPGMQLLSLQGGTVVPRLLARDRLRTHVIAGPDHTFTARWTHPVLVDRLTSVIRAISEARAARDA